jgi:cell wall-associated NlpC family hydrolase
VATPRLTSRLLRPAAVLALAAATLGVFPGAGDAAPRPTAPQPSAPTTAAEARAQLAALSEEAEKVAEQYNDARVLLARRQREFKAADRQARAIQAQYAKLAGQVKQVVSAAYKNVPFGQFTTLLTSSSPREFIDQLSTLGLLANRRGALLRQVAAVQARAVQAQARAQAALSAAQKTESEIVAKRADLARRGKVLRSLLSHLSAQDRLALAGGTADVRGSRGATRGPINVGPASGAAQKAVATAVSRLGDPYCWGCAGPTQFDCSGLTKYAWGSAGVGLPHSSSAQYGAGTHVSRGEVRAGDLVFFYSPIHHVGIAINNSQMIHAPTYGEPVQVGSIDSFPYAGATRVG